MLGSATQALGAACLTNKNSERDEEILEEKMQRRMNFPRRWVVGVLLVVAGFALAAVSLTRPVSGNDSESWIARGAGTTIVSAGLGPSGHFAPVLTKLAFHAQRSVSGVTGSFDCLALAPADPASTKGSGEFSANGMYVTGQITGATLPGDTVILTGTSTITGLGAGTNVPFTFVVEKGGPGAAATLTVNSLPTFPFREVLLEGAFQVHSED